MLNYAGILANLHTVLIISKIHHTEPCSKNEEVSNKQFELATYSTLAGSSTTVEMKELRQMLHVQHFLSIQC